MVFYCPLSHSYGHENCLRTNRLWPHTSSLRRFFLYLAWRILQATFFSMEIHVNIITGMVPLEALVSLLNISFQLSRRAGHIPCPRTFTIFTY